jgi:hypothetical protein
MRLQSISAKGTFLILLDFLSGPLLIWFPFPLGKGLGVRLFGSFTTPAPQSYPPLQKGEGLGERFLSQGAT